MSRILNRFESDELITRESSPRDGRVLLLCLTPKGKRVLSILEEKSTNQIRGLICNLTDEQKEKLVESLKYATKALSSSLNSSDDENNNEFKCSSQYNKANNGNIYIMF